MTTDERDTVAWRIFLAEATARLRDAGVGSAEVDARRIVEQASGYEGAELFLGLDEPATHRGVVQFDRMLARRVAGEPLQYVLGAWGFRTLDLFVDRRVLIPRPETESVVERALGELDRLRAGSASSARPFTVVDLGTGSGAIALSIAAERPGIDVWATDVSPDALAVARSNLAGLGRAGARVRLSEGSWLDALPDELRGSIDLIVTNPPYVATDDDLPSEVQDWEPTQALIAGPTGREAIEQILTRAPGWLATRGALVVELAPGQAAFVAAFARDVGFDETEVAPDLTGRDRMVIARRGGG